MNKKISVYYIALLALVAFQVITTVVQGSLVVHHGKKMSQIHAQTQELRQQKLQLKTAIAEESSLAQVSLSVSDAGFSPIEKPILLSAEKTVAYSGL